MTKIKREEWILEDPKSKEWTIEGMQKAIEKIAKKYNVTIIRLAETRQSSRGMERLYQIKGTEADVNHFLSHLPGWAWIYSDT